MVGTNSVWKKESKIILILAIGLAFLGNPVMAQSQVQELLECDIPPVDIPGKDLDDFPRFPGSVRIQYAQDKGRYSFTEGTQVRGTMNKFLSPTGLKALMEYYSKNVNEKGWKIVSSQYLDTNKANLTLEKKPRRVMLTMEPNMKTVPNPVPQGGRGNLSRSNAPAPPLRLRTKCYEVTIFIYEIPKPKDQGRGMTGFPPR